MQRLIIIFISFIISVNLVVASDDVQQKITQKLKSLQSNIDIESITPSPVTNLFKVELVGGRQLYISADAKYLLQGSLYEITEQGITNLTQQDEKKGIAKAINALDTSKMIIFAPENPKTHITVFTDTTCGYCQKLHSEIAEINALGIEVRYVAFPRGGKESEGYTELHNVWCAANQQEAITRAKQRKPVPAANMLCKSPIMQHYAVGELIGVTGTPAIVLEDGTLIPGYRPAQELAKIALANKNK